MVKFGPRNFNRLALAARLARPSGALTRRGRMIRPATAVAKRTAPRLASLTMVQRRRKHNLGRRPIQNPGGIVTQSVFSRYTKPSFGAKVRKNASSPNYGITNASATFDALSGFQGVNAQSYCFQSQLISLFGNMPTTAPAGNETRRLLYESFQRKIMYTNASSASAILDLYDIVCKQDCDLFADAAWSDGVNMETSLPAGTPPYKVLGIKPWHSQRFNEFYTVVKKTTVNLTAGASHQHSVSIKPNAIIKEQRVRENTAYRGLSYVTIAVVKGVPVCDDADVPRLVSTAPIRIDIVSETSQKYRWISDTDTDLYVTNNLTTLLQPENMNVFQGQAQPVTAAQ